MPKIDYMMIRNGPDLYPCTGSDCRQQKRNSIVEKENINIINSIGSHKLQLCKIEIEILYKKCFQLYIFPAFS